MCGAAQYDPCLTCDLLLQLVDAAHVLLRSEFIAGVLLHHVLLLHARSLAQASTTGLHKVRLVWQRVADYWSKRLGERSAQDLVQGLVTLGMAG